VKDNIHYVDEQTVLYPAGSNIVLYSIEQKTQKFIPISDKGESITALALSSNKKILAVAERSEKPQVIIYDVATIRKRKVLQITETECKDFISIAFSNDSKYLITQSGAPDWTLYYWSWEKAKIMATIRTSNLQGSPISQISFNPADVTQICVTGDGIFKLFRYSEGILKQFGFQKMESRVNALYITYLELPMSCLELGRTCSYRYSGWKNHSF
jgi:WD40 repeat protein